MFLMSGISKLWSPMLLLAALAGAITLRGAETPIAGSKPVGERPSTAEEAIRRAYETRHDFKFDEMPLEDVVDYLQGQLKIAVVLDKKTLEDEGFDTAAPVTCNLVGLRFEDALDLILAPLGLTYCIDDDRLLVTTGKWALGHLETKVYPVADLVSQVERQGKESLDFDSLIHLIRSTGSSSWAEAEGQTIVPYGADGLRVLVARQTQYAHAEIADLLAELRKLRKPAAGQPLPVNPIAAAPNDPEEEIRRVLGKRHDFQFVEKPLEEVSVELRAQLGIQIELDRKALEDEGVDEATPVSCRLRGVRVRAGLNFILSPIGLTYVIKNGVLLITTRVQAEESLQRRVYDVADLVQTKEGVDFDSLIELITSVVAPQAWDESGGRGSIQLFSATGIRALVFRQSEYVHEQCGELLAGLRKVRDNPAAPAGKPALRFGKEADPELEAAIGKALDTRHDFQFAEKPLDQVLDNLGAQLRINLVLERRALEDEEIQTTSPVNIDRRGIRVRSGLHLILSPWGLAWVICDGVLVVTTKVQAAESLEGKIYDVADLVVRTNSQGLQSLEFESLMDVVCSTITPQDWGRASVNHYDARGLRVLVVNQTEDAHLQIDELFATLRKTRAAPPVKSPPASKPPPPGDKAKRR